MVYIPYHEELLLQLENVKNYLVVVVLFDLQVLHVESVAGPAVVECHAVLLVLGIIRCQRYLSHVPPEGVLPENRQ